MHAGVSFAMVVRRNLALQAIAGRRPLQVAAPAKPQEQPFTTLRTAITSHPLRTTPSTHSDNISLHLMPTAGGRVTVHIQQNLATSGAGASTSQDPSSTDVSSGEQVSSSFQSAHSPETTSCSPSSSSQFPQRSSVADAAAALGALNVGGTFTSKTPCFAPPDHQLSLRYPCTGVQSTECPTTEPPSLPTPEFCAHATPSYSPNLTGHGQALCSCATVHTSLLPTGACIAESPAESSGSSCALKVQAAQLATPQVQEPPSSPSAVSDESDESASSQSSSCASSSDSSDSSKDSDTSADDAATQGVQKPGSVCTVWGSKLIQDENEQYTVDELIMAQRMEDEEAAQQEDEQTWLQDADASGGTASNLEQILMERSQLFAALADAWGREAEVAKILASATTLPSGPRSGAVC